MCRSCEAANVPMVSLQEISNEGSRGIPIWQPFSKAFLWQLTASEGLDVVA